MKAILLLILIISACSCNKEHEPTITGKWRTIESIDDVSTTSLTTPENNYIQFNADGSFTMDSNPYGYYKAFKQYNRYKIESGNMIMFYNNSDTVVVPYTLDHKLTFSYR